MIPYEGQEAQVMNPHYYIMRHKKILRLEEGVSYSSLPEHVRANVLEHEEVVSLDQNQANWRVAIFRDEIMDMEEYLEWLGSSEAKLLGEDFGEEVKDDCVID